MPRDPEKNKQQARERRAQRKANRLCIDCAAGLQEDDGVRCVECYDKILLASYRYRVRNQKRVNARAREWHRKRRATHAAEENAKQRARRLAHKIAGLCQLCKNPSLEDNVYCALHREAARINTKNNWRKKNWSKRKIAANGGLEVPPKMRTGELTPPNVEKPPTTKQLHAYRPLDESEDRLRVKILLVMRWHDWIATREIGDILELDELDRNHVAHIMRRLRKAGQVDVRTVRGVFRGVSSGEIQEFRLTAEGRALSDRLRNGEVLPIRRAA